MKAWIDDLIIHAKTESELVNALEKCFRTCKKYNLFLSAKKCSFYVRTVKWCGRLIDHEGHRMDPKNIEARQNMDMPKMADELRQFIHCCRWMSPSIPDFHETIDPPQHF